MGWQWERHCRGYWWREMWRPGHYVVVGRGVRVVIVWGAWERIHVERRVLERGVLSEKRCLRWEKKWMTNEGGERVFIMRERREKEAKEAKQFWWRGRWRHPSRKKGRWWCGVDLYTPSGQTGRLIWWYSAPFPAPTSPNGYFKYILFYFISFIYFFWWWFDNTNKTQNNLNSSSWVSV